MATDSELLHAWHGGDRDAAARLVERHYDAIARFFGNKAPDHADDLVQRTFLACAESAGSFRADGSFRAFLFGIARNVLYEHIRGRVRDGRNEPDFRSSALVDLAPGVSTMVVQRNEQRLIARALQCVPVELQVLLELYYWEDLSVDEVAEATGIPSGTVKSRLHRARELLRDALERLPATEEERRTAAALLMPEARAPNLG